MIWGILIGFYFGFGLGMGVFMHADCIDTRGNREIGILSTLVFFLWAPLLLASGIAVVYLALKENRKKWREWQSRALTEDDDNLWMPSLRIGTTHGLNSAIDDAGWFTVEVRGGKPATYWQRGYEPGSRKWT